MSNNVVRLEFAQFGHFTKFKVFRSPEPMVPGSMPEPIADNLKTMFFVDSNVPDGDSYYRVEVERDGEFILSEEMYIKVTNEWSPEQVTYVASFDARTLQVGSVSEWSCAKSGAKLLPLNPNSVLTRTDYDSTPVFRITTGQLHSNDAVLVDSTKGTEKYSMLTLFRKNALDTKLQSRFVAGFRTPQGGTVRFGVYADDASAGNLNKIVLGGRRLDSNPYSYLASPNPVKVDSFNLVYSEVDHTKATYKMSVDGEVTTGSTGHGLGSISDTSSARFDIGGGSVGFFGDIAYVILFRDALNNSTMRKLEGWAAHEFNVTYTLPDNHPYKWVKPIVTEDNKPYLGRVETPINQALFFMGVSGEFDTLSYYVSADPFNADSLPPPLKEGLTTARIYDGSQVDGDYYGMVVARKGEGAYSSELIPFSVKTGDPRWGDVVCLLRFDGNVTDLKGNTWSGSGMAYDTGRFGQGFRASQNLGTRQAYSSSQLHLQLLNTSFTVEFWVKYLAHNGQYGGLVTNRNTGSFFSWAITTIPNTGYVRFEVDGVGALQTTEELPVGEFVHVAIEFDRVRKELRGFFDGRLVGFSTFTSTSALKNIDYPIRIGALNSSGNFRPEAVIDEVRITKNGCRYVTEFDPPERYFPNYLPPTE